MFGLPKAQKVLGLVARVRELGFHKELFACASEDVIPCAAADPCAPLHKIHCYSADSKSFEDVKKIIM